MHAAIMIESDYSLITKTDFLIGPFRANLMVYAIITENLSFSSQIDMETGSLHSWIVLNIPVPALIDEDNCLKILRAWPQPRSSTP